MNDWRQNMLDRAVVEEFMDGEFEDWEDLEIPEDISRDALHG